MRVKIFFIVFILQLFPYKGRCQQEYNQYDSDSNKVGLWFENDGLVEVYYSSGLMDGIFKSYNSKNFRLSSLGSFTKGNKSGIWYYFDENSHLILQESKIELNIYDSVEVEDRNALKPKYKSYVRLYYSNGNIKEEGQVLYNEDIEIDYIKVGDWKYYNEQGENIQIKEN